LLRAAGVNLIKLSRQQTDPFLFRIIGLRTIARRGLLNRFGEGFVGFLAGIWSNLPTICLMESAAYLRFGRFGRFFNGVEGRGENWRAKTAFRWPHRRPYA